MYRGELHVLGMVRDVTERVRAYELLEQRVDERTRELSALLEVRTTSPRRWSCNPCWASSSTSFKGVVDYSGASILTVATTSWWPCDYRGRSRASGSWVCAGAPSPHGSTAG